MKRRDFFKYASLLGMGISMPWGSTVAQSPSEPYTGPYWILINAEGGWDPTLLFDPKGRANENTPEPINHYATDAILQTGNIRYAPRGNNQTFFEKYGSQLLIVNGIDTETNNHEVGVRHSWSGRFRDGYPTFGALLAAASGPGLPLSFITNGGYDSTAGVVPPSRVDRENLERLAFSNVFGEDPMDRFHSDYALNRIAAARQERQQVLLAQKKLPSVQRAINQLHLSHDGANELKRVFDYMPSGDASENPLLEQAQLAIAAYKAGISVSVNINYDGFDTHTNHDAEHEPLLDTLLEGIDLIIQETERQQVADNVIIVVASDFARTPWYNEEAGKDHWPISSMMFWGKGITGNRVIGATDKYQQAKKVNATTLQEDTDGIILTPAHMHRAMRKLAGVENSQGSQLFPLDVEDLDFFS